MRIAAIYDIHANLPALEAVLAEIRQAGADLVVVGGDVLPGPMPRESLACLRELDIPAQLIQGNGDRAVLEALAGQELGGLPAAVQEVVRWVARQLGPEDERWMRAWPKTAQVGVPGIGQVLFCHATPRNDTEIFTRLTPAERLLPIFAGLGMAVVVCGHTHMQFDRDVGGTRVVNAGSVGMPYGEPGAYWLMIDGAELELCRTPYDLERAAARVLATDYPQARDFVEHDLLRPRAESEVLELFARAELR
jgi:putative phosphoesterase